MNADDILKIIKAIPEYIIYIYPGYLTVYLYYFFRGRTLKDNSYIFVKTVAISYIHIATMEWIRSQIVINFLPISYGLKENIALITIAVLWAYAGYRVAVSKKIQNLFKSLKIKTTFHDNEIEVLADFSKGAWLCVYLKDDKVVYEGSLGHKELEEGKQKYICLNGFYKYFLDKNGKPKEPYIEDYEGNYKETVLIFYDSIKRIEKRNS